MKFLYLVFIGIINIFYSLGLSLIELVLFGKYFWWWKLHGLLFFSYLSDGPYLITKQEGKRAPVLAQNLIYGETPCLTIKKILEEANIQPTDHFVDLGCGRGLITIFVNLYFQIPTTGVEIIPTFIRRAQVISKTLGLTKVRFIKENLSWVTLEQVGRGTIFYLAGTTFQEELLAKITNRLELLPVGIKLITLSDSIISPHFKLIKVSEYYFSWGKTEVYFHEKVS
ncbi:MAG: methyltransferase domain-containing protein [Blastocatellia bacterium]|nr:methyltransferase domain-containing protein [Blastocatellia bacterium]